MTHHNARLVCTLLAGVLGMLLFSPGPAASLTLHHIHGLSYSADGTRLYIPMHHGLAFYSEHRWSKASGPAHDYMGFAVTQAFWYSSGHPAPGSPLRNPFGLIKSKDQGQTWEHLGLSGEADFHLLATSYQTGRVYVLSPAANSRMPRAGVYSTRDDGQRWRAAKGAGGGGNPLSLAVHPIQDNVVALGTDQGVYLSQDSGEHFQRLAEVPQVMAVFFAVDAPDLWFSSVAGKASLTRLQWQTGQTESVALPSMARDAVTYIAQNPVNRQEWALATHRRNVYVSLDSGRTWQQIAQEGETY